MFRVIPTLLLSRPTCTHALHRALFVTTDFALGPFWSKGGAGAYEGTGAGNAEKDNPPQGVEWGVAGKRSRGSCLWGPSGL